MNKLIGLMSKLSIQNTKLVIPLKPNIYHGRKKGQDRNNYETL